MRKRITWVREKATDAQLVASSRSGDIEGFQELVGRYQHRLFGLCYRLLGRHHDAEDACQEAFLRAYKALDRYDSARSFDRWLLTIAANCCVSMLRRRRPHQEVTEEGHEVGTTGPHPAEEAQTREFADAVAQAISDLGEPHRSAFVLFHQEGMSYEDVAQALDLPLGTVKSRVHRARKLLYNRLCEAGFLEKETLR